MSPNMTVRVHGEGDRILRKGKKQRVDIISRKEKIYNRVEGIKMFIQNWQ